MKKLITVIILSLSLNGIAQNGYVKTHTVGFEGGFFSRGLIGVGYEYNFLRKESFFLSAHGSAGVGSDFISSESGNNYFITLSPSFNLGRNTFHLMIGPEFKYVEFNESTFFDNAKGYGVGFSGGVGFYFRTNWCLKIRGSVNQIFAETEDFGSSFTLPGAGVSIGYSFGKQ